MAALKAANLGLRFLLELAALVALGYWGFHRSGGVPAKLALGLGAPLLAIVIWALIVAPQASHVLPPLPRFVVGLLVLELGAGALIASGRSTLGVVFAIVVALNAVLDYAWR